MNVKMVLKGKMNVKMNFLECFLVRMGINDFEEGIGSGVLGMGRWV